MARESDVVRFGVRDRAGRRSDVWRLDVRRGEVYLSARDLRGVWHASIHESGECHVLQPDGRYAAQWRLPPAMRGVREALSILIPTAELRSLPHSPRREKPTTWIAAPPANCFVRVFVLLVTSREELGEPWPGQRDRAARIFHRPLPNGAGLEVVAVGYRVPEWLADDIATARAAPLPPVSPGKSTYARMLLWVERTGGERYFVDAAPAGPAA